MYPNPHWGKGPDGKPDDFSCWRWEERVGYYYSQTEQWDTSWEHAPNEDCSPEEKDKDHLVVVGQEVLAII